MIDVVIFVALITVFFAVMILISRPLWRRPKPPVRPTFNPKPTSGGGIQRTRRTWDNPRPSRGDDATVWYPDGPGGQISVPQADPPFTGGGGTFGGAGASGSWDAPAQSAAVSDSSSTSSSNDSGSSSSSSSGDSGGGSSGGGGDGS